MPISTSGYHTCTINGKCCYTHRYVWEQAHGPIPAGKYIDHINGDKLDNRLGEPPTVRQLREQLQHRPAG